MMRIGALLQQKQQQQQQIWGLPSLGFLGGRSRSGTALCKCKFEGKGVEWKQGFRSSSSCNAIDYTVRNGRWRRRRGSGLEAVMDNSGVEKRVAEALELESLVVGEPGLKRSWTLNSKINTASKWVVVGMIAAGVLWRHDDHAVWFSVGSVVNGGFCKLLKYLINENRPPTADGVKGDPGMPSSHAQGFFYIASYISVAWLLWQGINVWSSTIALGILLSCAYLSWLRVGEGLHTAPQVLVGGSLGTAASACWLYLWKTGVESVVQSSLTAKFILYMSFIAACAASYFMSIKDWEFGQP